MRSEVKSLLLIALLLGSPGVYSQENLDESDLEALLEESTETPSTQALSDSPETLSSETVDLEALELNEPEAPTTPVETTEAPIEEAPVESITPSDIPAETETVQTIDNPLEPLSGPSDTVAIPSADDDLESLKSDLEDEGIFTPAPEAGTLAEKPETEEKKPAPKKNEPAPQIAKPGEADVFDVGDEEATLLKLARNIEGQIPDSEWSEIATAAKVDAYTVVKNDWLFKISKRLFGTGFYYPKIWALNSYITNPHFIEPGMILSFTTGSSSKAPEVKLGAFTTEELKSAPGTSGIKRSSDLANFGENSIPDWVKEKRELEKQGVYFQYASEETMSDLEKAGARALNREYESYEPPRSDFDVIVPKNYDKSGFDRSSRIAYSFKEGFYLSTFVSTNIVQDLGYIANGPDENIWFSTLDHAYVKFDESINAVAGDKFSVYTSGGLVRQENSDREGYKYSIVGQIKLIRQIEDKWEVEFIEVSGTPQRGDRITVYTPKIERITRTYNSRLIEAAVMTGYEPGQNILGFGDVIYLDRGRADGVEMGNVFEIYGFKDRLTNKRITPQPTYKIGELTVITLTDNFATAIVTNSIRDFYPGDIAITKTKEAYLREMRAAELKSKATQETLGGKALEELDVELNLDDLNDDLLKQADKIKLTEDELAELERQEREKSVIKDSERDLKALERLENEIESAEKILNDARLDEDKLLEEQSLEDLEKKRGLKDTESLDEIEENLGKRYMDEDLNSKENPYGLTEFDVEEIDELLNTEKNQ